MNLTNFSLPLTSLSKKINLTNSSPSLSTSSKKMNLTSFSSSFLTSSFQKFNTSSKPNLEKLEAVKESIWLLSKYEKDVVAGALKKREEYRKKTPSDNMDL